MSSFNYAFTITLKPNLYRYPLEKQYDETYLYVSEKLLTIAQQLTMVAEVTKAGNLHFHGVICFTLSKHKHIKSNNKNFIDLFRNDHIVGFTNLKQIDNEQGWIEYMSKELESFLQVNNRRPIIQDQFECFSESQHAQYALQW